MWIRLLVVECHVPFCVTVTLPFTSDLITRIIFPIFEVGIPNLVCGYILGGGVSYLILGSM